MKNILLSATIALASLLPLTLPAQANIPKGSCLSDSEIFVGFIQEKTLCYQRHDKYDVFVLYENLNTNFKDCRWITVFRQKESNKTAIGFKDYATDTTLFLDGRKFSRWGDNPNPTLVKEHYEEIQSILNFSDAVYAELDKRNLAEF